MATKRKREWNRETLADGCLALRQPNGQVMRNVMGVAVRFTSEADRDAYLAKQTGVHKPGPKMQCWGWEGKFPQRDPNGVCARSF